MLAGADPGFDQGGPQIVTGLKLPFWGLNFVEFWCWGLIFGDQGGPGPPGPPLDPPLVRYEYQGEETEQIISVICHVTKHKSELLLSLTMLNFKNDLPLRFSPMNFKYMIC